jgi:hypothetical protein
LTEPARGATPEDWFQFDFVLGLGGNLLPCVPAAPDVRVVKGSQLEGKAGKIPSQFNRDGEAHGLKDWSKREIMSAEVQQWSADPRLNICVRTGPISGVYALDIDINSDQAGAVRSAVAEVFGTELPTRSRANSQKVLLAFRMESPCKKRKIKLDSKPAGPAIELLADGQQFVAAGSHSSGCRYRWLPELPSSLPTITLDQLNQLWIQLTETYASPESRQANLIVLGKGQSVLTQTSTSSPATGYTSDLTTTESLRTTITDSDWDQLISALRFLVTHAGDEQTWAEIGMALISIKDSGKPVRQLWLDFSTKAPNWQPGAAEQWWENHTRG